VAAPAKITQSRALRTRMTAGSSPMAGPGAGIVEQRFHYEHELSALSGGVQTQHQRSRGINVARRF